MSGVNTSSCNINNSGGDNSGDNLRSMSIMMSSFSALLVSLLPSSTFNSFSANSIVSLPSCFEKSLRTQQKLHSLRIFSVYAHKCYMEQVYKNFRPNQLVIENKISIILIIVLQILGHHRLGFALVIAICLLRDNNRANSCMIPSNLRSRRSR
ncbi:hypothetical protein VNO78_11676 [Psophocarpus tetragonolobus]|uniref:Uncharacterized protein n=1 Tax=Psophocarpus tetragonolobus TaxID=3891 RepID=A0AAN9SUN4_PSOTE